MSSILQCPFVKVSSYSSTSSCLEKLLNESENDKVTAYREHTLGLIFNLDEPRYSSFFLIHSRESRIITFYWRIEIQNFIGRNRETLESGKKLAGVLVPGID